MIIGFQIWADYGHFSHPATIYSSLTYPVPPKTTIMGMLGAIAGEEDYLALNAMRYAVIVEQLDGKRQFCFNGIKDALTQLNPAKGSGFTKGRKQFYRELLVNPHYRIYCDLSDVAKDFKERLVEILKSKRSIYPLYMGINFCLAEYRFLGLFESIQKKEDKVWINSMIPLSYDFECEPNKQYTDVRMACSVKKERIFGDFRDFLVETSGQPILCKNADFDEIDGKKIVWS